MNLSVFAVLAVLASPASNPTVITSVASSGFDVKCGGQYMLTEEQKGRYGVTGDLCVTKVLQVLLGYDIANVCAYSGNTASQIFFKNGSACYFFKNDVILKADMTAVPYPWTIENFGAQMTAGMKDIKARMMDNFDADVNGYRVHFNTKEGTVALMEPAPADVRIPAGSMIYRKPLKRVVEGSAVETRGLTGTTGLILQIGANKEGATPEEIVEYFKLAIRESGCKWFICLRQNRVKSDSDLNNAEILLKKTFGSRYIDHMSYLVTRKALDDQGIRPTTSEQYPDENGVNSNPLTPLQIEKNVPCDMECIANGQVPSSFWYGAWREDGVKTNIGHFNAQGLECLGKYLYRKIIELEIVK